MCCSETNQMQQLEEVIKKYKSTQGALIPVLHEAQDIFGYLPPEVMKRVARPFFRSFLGRKRANIASVSVWVLPAMSKARRTFWINSRRD